MESTTIKKVKDIVINALNKFWITLQTKIVQKTDIVNSLTNLSTKAPLSAKQGYVLKGLVDECKKNIGDVFSEESTYSIGDYVIYENTLYKFTADKDAGAWDGTKANAVKVADEISSLNGNMTEILKFNDYVTPGKSLNGNSNTSFTLNITVPPGYKMLGTVSICGNYPNIIIGDVTIKTDSITGYMYNTISYNYTDAKVKARVVYVKI